MEAFDRLIRDEIGDRSSLDAVVSAWLPEARREFELRRKQSVFKAMCQLKRSSAETVLATVLLHPARTAGLLDVVWINGVLGAHRLRPDAGVRLTTRRLAVTEPPRHPADLAGGEITPAGGLAGARLDRFCSDPPPPIEVRPAGEAVHYVLGPTGVGPKAAVDLVFAEVNRDEMPAAVPAGSGRRAWLFAEIATPAKALHFDVLVHADVYPGIDPELILYDTSFEGVADVNDRGRDIDRLVMAESILPLGSDVRRFHTSAVPRSVELLEHVCSSLAWDGERFRGYRSSIEYPIYGCQVTMAFRPPEV